MGRGGPVGKSRFVEPCPGVPGCVQYYYSRATGCSYDYDTRGWTVEPGYQALLLDHFRSRQYRPVMRFLLSLENRGTFSWPHPPGEVVTALAEAGLRIEFLHEFPFSIEKFFPFMEEREDGLLYLTKYDGSIPLMYSVKARKPASG